MDTRTRIPVTHEQISLKEVLEVLWKNRWRAAAFTAVLVALALAAALLLPKEYEATILVSPVSSTPGGSRLGAGGSAASEFGGLASLAGISLQANTQREETIAILKSAALTEKYINDNHLLPVLYAKLWDAQQQRWKVSNPKKIPTLWKANERFKGDVRSVTDSVKTGLVTLSITWKDPVVAAQWANGLVKATNDYMRGQAITEAETNIAYLEQQEAKTDVVGVKQAIDTVLENEIYKEMLARGSEEYALKILDPALAPEKPSSPKPVLWTLLAFLTGLLLSLLSAFVSVAWRTP